MAANQQMAQVKRLRAQVQFLAITGQRIPALGVRVFREVYQDTDRSVSGPLFFAERGLKRMKARTRINYVLQISPHSEPSGLNNVKTYHELPF